MMMGEGGFIVKSSDHGKSWSMVYSAEKWSGEDAGLLQRSAIGKRLALSKNYAVNNVVIVATQRLMRSSDGGVTFEPAHELGNGGHFTCVFSHDVGLFAATSMGQVFREQARRGMAHPP